jgi:hypothetical protein
VEAIAVVNGAVINIGNQVRRVDNADGRFAYHLHYDVALIDLGEKPGD